MSFKLRAIQPKEFVGDEALTISTADGRYAKKTDIPTDYVTIGTSQTVSGDKIFSGNTTLGTTTVDTSNGLSLKTGRNTITLKAGSGVLTVNNTTIPTVSTNNTFTGTTTFNNTVNLNSTLTVAGTSTFNNNVNIGSQYKLGFGTNYVQDSGGGDSLKITFANGQIRYLGSDANNDGDYTTKSYVDGRIKVARFYLKDFNITWRDTWKATSHVWFWAANITNFKTVISNRIGSNAKIISFTYNGNSGYDNSGIEFSIGKFIGSFPTNEYAFKPKNLYEGVSLTIRNHSTTSSAGDDYNSTINNSMIIVTYTD